MGCITCVFHPLSRIGWELNEKGNYRGFCHGVGFGIVASPCIGPALASLLVYIASTGNKFLGFWLLFVFAWGLGVLLIVLGTFSGAIKAHPEIRSLDGNGRKNIWTPFSRGGTYYLRLIISESAFVIILGLFLIITAVFSGGFDRLTHDSTNFQRAKRAFGLIAFIFGTYFLVGHLIIKGFILPLFSTTTPAQSVITQEKINWVLSEEEDENRLGWKASRQ